MDGEHAAAYRQATDGRVILATEPIAPRFSLHDAVRASEAWGANCGPGALAAILSMTLDEVRPHMGDFERKRYTNPTLMFESLDRAGAKWRSIGTTWPCYGLARIQWEGPWTAPGVPIRARYRHTHWVGAATIRNEVGIFDINCINNGTGWVRIKEWETIVVPWIIMEAVPRANGKWHITHAIEVDRTLQN